MSLAARIFVVLLLAVSGGVLIAGIVVMFLAAGSRADDEAAADPPFGDPSWDRSGVVPLARYVVFAGSQDDPLGGWWDRRSDWLTIESARRDAVAAVLDRETVRWAHIIDLATNQVVAVYGSPTPKDLTPGDDHG